MKISRRNNLFIYIFIGVLLNVILSHAHAQDFVVSKHDRNIGYTADYFKRTITVTAVGASTARQTSMAEKRLWAVTEARKNCITQAAVAIGEIAVEGKTLLNNGRLEQTVMEVKIQEYIRGIKDLKEEYETLS
ncbi:hypothetical protein ACFL6L_04650, partial [candidate division KSB1 bacterium]